MTLTVKEERQYQQFNVYNEKVKHLIANDASLYRRLLLTDPTVSSGIYLPKITSTSRLTNNPFFILLLLGVREEIKDEVTKIVENVKKLPGWNRYLTLFHYHFDEFIKLNNSYINEIEANHKNGFIDDKAVLQMFRKGPISWIREREEIQNMFSFLCILAMEHSRDLYYHLVTLSEVMTVQVASITIFSKYVKSFHDVVFEFY